jgi:uncharacterized integral membrane protein (TIGR00698 family)
MAAGLLLGIIIASCIKLPALFDSGIHFSMKTLLAVGIVLLGFKLNLHAIASLPLSVPIIIVVTSLGALVSAIFVGKWLGCDSGSALLIGIGNAICGSSAIMASSHVVPLKDKHQISIAVTTVNILGLVIVFALPPLAHLLHLSDLHMGLWSGATGQAVPQAIAAGFSFSQHAGLYATAIKLTRVLQLGIYVLVLKLFFHRSQKVSTDKTSRIKHLLNYIPLFIILFVLAVLFNSFVSLPPFSIGHNTINPHLWLGDISAFLLTMALTAIGLHSNLKTLLRYGGKNLIVGVASTLVAVLIALGSAVIFL